MYLVVVGLLLLLMKVADFGPVGAWSWWTVLLPFAGAVAWWSFADATGYNERQSMKRMERAKQDRQRKTRESLGLPGHKRN